MNTLTQVGTAHINFKTGAVYTSATHLSKADLQPSPKDKGIAKQFTDKNGKQVEYKVYSILDAVPKATKVKTTKKATKATKASTEYTELNDKVNQLASNLETLVQALQAK